MSKELINEFSAYLKSANRSESTVIAYTKDIAQLMEYSPKPVTELNNDDLKEIIQELVNHFAFTPKTISRKLNSFRMFYKFLMEKGKVSFNPADSIDHPKFTPKQPRVLSPMEYLALREVTRSNNRLYTMIELMLQTGMRIGELSRVKVGDVNLKSNPAVIHIAAYSTNPSRDIPLSPKLADLLSKFISSLPTKTTSETPLFSTRQGRSIIVRNIRSSIDRAMQKTGIENACVNDLRNTFIIAQLKAGVPIDTIAQVVGHRSKVTTNKYLDLLDKPYANNGESRIIDL